MTEEIEKTEDPAVFTPVDSSFLARLKKSGISLYIAVVIAIGVGAALYYKREPILRYVAEQSGIQTADGAIEEIVARAQEYIQLSKDYATATSDAKRKELFDKRSYVLGRIYTLAAKIPADRMPDTVKRFVRHTD